MDPYDNFKLVVPIPTHSLDGDLPSVSPVRGRHKPGH